MRRIDIVSPGPFRDLACLAILEALPIDGRPVCYATLALAAGEDSGPIVGGLIDDGRIQMIERDGARLYARTMH